MTELTRDQQSMLAFIKDPLHNGIHTWPGTDDANQDKIFATCCKLEEMELVERKIDDPTHVFFVAVE